MSFQNAIPTVAKRDAPTVKRPRIPAKIQIACKAIIYEGQELAEAAATADITTRALRLALERRHVIAFMKAEREVFRSYVSAQNIHHAKRLRDTTTNGVAKLGAIRYLDGQDEQGISTAGQRQSPGVTIVIEAPRDTARVIDASRSQTDVADSPVTYQRVDGD